MSGEASVSVEPGKGAFDHPVPGRQNEALGGIGPIGDCGSPGAVPEQGPGKLFPDVSAIGEDVTQPGVEPASGLQHERGTVAILNIGRMHHGFDEKAVGVGEDMALAALHLLAGVTRAARRPRSS